MSDTDNTPTITIDPYYARQAKELVDLLFDKGFLSDDVSRESMRWLEEYLGFYLQMNTETNLRAKELVKGIRDRAVRESVGATP